MGSLSQPLMLLRHGFLISSFRYVTKGTAGIKVRKVKAQAMPQH